MTLDIFIVVICTSTAAAYGHYKLRKKLNFGLSLVIIAISAALGFAMGWFTFPVILVLANSAKLNALIALVEHRVIVGAIGIGLVTVTAGAFYSFFGWLRGQLKAPEKIE